MKIVNPLYDHALRRTFDTNLRYSVAGEPADRSTGERPDGFSPDHIELR
jgi:hypothetical protein